MFSRSSFSPVSFSLISFHGAQQQPAQQDGRSGYWRLFFTELQEEALKPKPKVTVKPQEESNEQVQGQTAPQGTRKGKTRKPPVVAVEQYPEVIPFRRRPIYSTSEPVLENFPLWVTALATTRNEWYLTYGKLLEHNEQVIIYRKKQEAANDADIRLRLLLLVA